MRTKGTFDVKYRINSNDMRNRPYCPLRERTCIIIFKIIEVINIKKFKRR